jgi:hypothetical protein
MRVAYFTNETWTGYQSSLLAICVCVAKDLASELGRQQNKVKPRNPHPLPTPGGFSFTPAPMSWGWDTRHHAGCRPATKSSATYRVLTHVPAISAICMSPRVWTCTWTLVPKKLVYVRMQQQGRELGMNSTMWEGWIGPGYLNLREAWEMQAATLCGSCRNYMLYFIICQNFILQIAFLSYRQCTDNVKMLDFYILKSL